MSLQRLQVICNVGKCFALFPSTSDVKPVTQCQKIFAIMLSSMATIWMIICISNKNFYTYYIHIKMIVCLLTDITLLSIYVTGVIDVTFRKRDQWSKLMKNLKIIYNSRKMKYFTSFLMAQGIYFITMGVTTFSFYEIQGVRYFREFSCSMALIYTKYLQKLFLYVILKMIAETYRSLGQQLRSLMVKSNTQHVSMVLRRIKYFAEVLKDTVNIFNGIFGWPITLILTFTILHLLNYLDYTFIAITNLDEMFVMKYIISDIMMIVFNLVSDLCLD
jgi:gustatory receptor